MPYHHSFSGMSLTGLRRTTEPNVKGIDGFSRLISSIQAAIIFFQKSRAMENMIYEMLQPILLLNVVMTVVIVYLLEVR